MCALTGRADCRNASWYRKHFSLPVEWQAEGETYVHFEGVFHHATIFLNGKHAHHSERARTHGIL